MNLDNLRQMALDYFRNGGDPKDLIHETVAARTDYKDDKPRRVVYDAQYEVFGQYAVDKNGDPAVQGAIAVRLTKPWGWGGIKPGAIGIMGGRIGRPRDGGGITFNYSAFIGPGSRWSLDGIWCSCSGGPGTIFTSADKLSFAGEWTSIRCWRWREYPQGDGAEHYMLSVPVFNWAPTDSD